MTDLELPVYQLVAIALAATFFFLLQVVFWWWRARSQSRQDRLYQRLRGTDTAERSAAIRIRDRRAGTEERFSLSRVAAARPIAQVVRQIEDSLVQAGLGWTVGQYLLYLLLSAGGAFVVGALLLEDPLLGGASALLPPVALYVMVMRKRDARLKLMDKQLPRALELMIFSLRAGYSFEESIKVAAEEIDAPLARELDRCYEEYSLGRPIEEALSHMRERWPAMRTLYGFVEAVSVLKRTGGNLVEVMETLIESLHSQAAYEAKHRALTAEGRMSGIILMLLPVASLIWQLITNGEQLRTAWQTESGALMLGLSATLWVVGALWVNRLTNPARASR